MESDRGDAAGYCVGAGYWADTGENAVPLNHKPQAAITIAARDARERRRVGRELVRIARMDIGAVVGRFLGDRNVMRVVLPHRGCRHAKEFRVTA